MSELKDVAKRMPVATIEAGELAEPPIATPDQYERIGTFELNAGLPLLQVQHQVLCEERALIGCFGSWRSGKTRAGALRITRCAVANGWRPIYGRRSPFSYVISETNKVIADATIPELLSVLPREIINRVWETKGAERIRLVNGHDYVFRTWSGVLEGGSACGVWMDEAHKLDGPRGIEHAWNNFALRATDTRARDKVVIATGIPEYGFMSDTFNREPTERRVTYLCSLLDNFYLEEADIAPLYESTTAEEAEAVIHGRWRKPSDVIYYAFDEGEGGNLVDHRGARSAPVDLSIDLGDRGFMLITQRITLVCRRRDGTTYKAPGILVVEERRPSQESVRQALTKFVDEKKWKLTRDSRVYVDPKADRDELEAIREVLGITDTGGPTLVKKSAQDRAYDREYGHRCVNAALRDLNGNRRLLFSSSLPRTKRSIITAMRRYRRKDNGKEYRDNWIDHAADCLRYVVADQLPLKGGGVHVRRRAA